MEPQPDFQRVVKMARHQETDRVPLCEVLIEYPIMSQFLGRTVEPDDLASQVEFWQKAGYDYIPLPVSMMNPGKVTQESVISRAIREAMSRDSADGAAEGDDKSWNLEFTSFIHDRAEFERFPWEAAGALDFSKLEAVGPLLPPGMKAVAVSGKIFTLTWMLMGFNHFATSLIIEEDLVADVFKQVAQIQFSALDKALALPWVGGVWAVDDLAFGTGPMISPQAFRDHVFPWYGEMAKRCHAKDRIFFLHSDGDLSALMDDLIDMGLDVLQPIDPTCMDIAAVKRQWGDRLALVGNVSNELLRSGQPSEVEARVKELLSQVAPGGGYGLGSGNSVPAWSKFENYQAMRQTCLKYGAYPINL